MILREEVYIFKEDRNSYGRIILEKCAIMKHVEGIFGWYEKSWLYDRDFYKFFFHQSVLKDWKCERPFVDTMMN